VASTSDQSVPRILLSTDVESLDFVTSPGFQTSRRVTSSDRYDKHDVVADLGGPVKPVIPTPLSVRHHEPQSWVDIGVRWTITTQPQLIHTARLLAGESVCTPGCTVYSISKLSSSLFSTMIIIFPIFIIVVIITVDFSVPPRSGKFPTLCFVFSHSGKLPLMEKFAVACLSE